jgi:transcriptional regulator with XRE-family HTH domain
MMDQTPAQDSLKIGTRIRSLRAEKGMSLNQLAQVAGVSKSNLSKIENNAISPTFETIERIARGLQVLPAALLSTPTPAREMLSFTDHGQGQRSDSGGYGFEFLFPDLPDRQMVPFVTTVAPRGQETFEKPSSHAGEEFFYVLEGKVAFLNDGDHRVMQRGDSVYFSSDLPHRVTNLTDSPARLLWVWMG